MLSKAGMISFAIGVIMLFGEHYLTQALGRLAAFIAAGTESQTANEFVLGLYLVVQGGGLALIVAGAIMFIVGRTRERVPASS
jgi:hypothetical protein